MRSPELADQDRRDYLKEQSSLLRGLCPRAPGIYRLTRQNGVGLFTMESESFPVVIKLPRSDPAEFPGYFPP
jgi:hypothetical protein